jgi:hypothetical protein
MLQGTFETLALPEVLALLAHSRKTGALWLEAGAATAALYIVDGRCCAAQSGDQTGPVSDAPSLLARVVDLCFAAARQEDGTFRFGGEEPPWTCAESIDLEVAIEELARLVDEWREIQAVIPSLDSRIRLCDELGVDELAVDRDRWQLLVAIDGRRSVRELVRKVNRPLLDICHAVVSLVESGAVAVVASPTPSTRAGSVKRAEAKVAVEPETPYGPGVESPHPGPTTDGDDEPGNGKGQYLKVFSGLRDR